jgi:hypothetical protein
MRPALGRWGISIKYIAVKYLAVLLPKRPCNDRFTYKTATWIQEWLKTLKTIRWGF